MTQLSTLISKFSVVTVLALCLNLTGCGYNKLQIQDEAITAKWSEVVNQYQRRSDLIPNIVNVTEGYIKKEKEILVELTQARASAGSLQVTPEVLNDPAALKKFQQAQSSIDNSLSKLMMVSEDYPELKSDALFRDLTAQLEGTENRIATARNRYIKSVQAYNGTVRKFPTNLTAMAFGMDKKANFSVDNEKQIAQAPVVNIQ